jgi:hypothetical protein
MSTEAKETLVDFWKSMFYHTFTNNNKGKTMEKKKRGPRPDLVDRNQQNATHGMAGNRTYRIWLGLRSRCNNPTNKDFKNYGGRGIKVDPTWNESFINFLMDMGEVPAGMSIDRIDNNGHYERSNCRWATPLENANNTRRTVFVTYNDKTQSIADWARETGLERKTLEYRIRIGWSADRALTTPSLIKRK